MISMDRTTPERFDGLQLGLQILFRKCATAVASITLYRPQKIPPTTALPGSRLLVAVPAGGAVLRGFSTDDFHARCMPWSTSSCSSSWLSNHSLSAAAISLLAHRRRSASRDFHRREGSASNLAARTTKLCKTWRPLRKAHSVRVSAGKPTNPAVCGPSARSRGPAKC